MKYPSPSTEGFGNAKFCYFISCPASELPIRDVVCQKKPEPDYKNRTYNEHAFCNQRSICNATKRRLSYIIFITRYQGTQRRYKGNIYITGWFPISQYRNIDAMKCDESGRIIYNSRMAFRSNNPVFSSIKDAIELSEEKWKSWFSTRMPRNLRNFAKFLNKENHSHIINAIKVHFEEHGSINKIDEYIKEIGRFNKKSNL